MEFGQDWPGPSRGPGPLLPHPHLPVSGTTGLCWPAGGRLDFLNPLTSSKPHTPQAPACSPGGAGEGKGGGALTAPPRLYFLLQISARHGQRGPDSSCLGNLGLGSLGNPLLVALWPWPLISKKPSGSP